MAFLAAFIPAAIGAVGSVLGGVNAKAEARGAGIAGKLAKEHEAKQLEQQAGQVKAAAQRDALEEEKRGELIASRALALLAASGGGTMDPSAVNVIADINNEQAYRKAVSLYQGEEQSRQLNMAAGLARYEGNEILLGRMAQGRAQQRAADWQAASYIAQGGSSLYSNYAKNQGYK